MKESDQNKEISVNDVGRWIAIGIGIGVAPGVAIDEWLLAGEAWHRFEG